MARPGRPRMPKAPLPGTVESFLDMLIAERGAALNTRHAYERDLADVCDAESEDEPRQGLCFRRLNGVDQLLRTLFREAIELREAFRGEVIQVRDVLDESLVDELLNPSV